ncbi:MAG: hypothetical protein K8S62_10785 [Candidatus Sabulitectum sp.]|nr:hypothetical protein [Candidatus Sabulitectum sp.]
MRRLIPFAVIAIIVNLFACQLSPARPERIVEERRLVVVDSLGVDYGEPYEVFGNISGAAFINDSTFVLLDKGYQELRVFDRDCNYIVTSNYCGNGPLEYRCAAYLAVVDSRFAVFEFNMPPRCVFFDNLAIPVSSVTFDGMTALQEPCFIDNSTVVGFVGSIDREGDSVSIGYEICVWNTVSGRKERVLFSRYLEVDALESIYDLFVQLENSIVASSSGLVFVAPDAQDYKVLVFSMDGVLLDTLYAPHEQELRDADEIEMEQIWRKLRDGDMGNWEPSAHEPGITDLQVQNSTGCLWACHGSWFNPSFDVYTMNGELAFTCTCEGLPGDEMIAFGITDYGILAYTMCPGSFPRVYVMELQL